MYSQCGFQPGFLLLPTGFFSLQSFLEGLELNLNVRSVLFGLPTGRIQSALRLVNGLPLQLALLTLSGFLVRAFALAAILLLLKSERDPGPAARSVASLGCFHGLRLKELRPTFFEVSSPAR